ncbi:hypothetical protein LXL04_023988 [Taraxacum kok-saghyz]
MILLCDNEVSIHIENNLVFYKRIKHIEAVSHFTCEMPEDGTITTHPYKKLDGICVHEYITRFSNIYHIFDCFHGYGFLLSCMCADYVFDHLPL